MSLGLAGPAAADSLTPAEEAPLAFVKDEPLQATCEDLAEGLDVPIRNETALTQTVRVLPVEFSDEQEAPTDVAKVCGGLEVKVAKDSLEGAESTTATLIAAEATEGTFSGSLALFAKGGRVTRLGISISPETTTAAPLEATPLVAKVSTERADADPLNQDPIWVAVEVPNDELPPAPKSEEGTEATLVGVLTGTNGTVPVTYSGKSRKLTDETSLVGLDVGDPGPGTYSGSVDLLPGDDEKGGVEIGLTVTTWWVIPALVLLLGIFLGIWMQRKLGLSGPRARLLARIDGLQKRHDDAAAGLRGAAGPPDGGGDGDGGGGTKPWSDFQIGDIGELETGLRDRVAKSTDRVLVQIAAGVLTDLEGRVSTVEAEIDLLDALPEHARDLERALQKLGSERPAELPPLKAADGPKPSLDGEAREALTGATVDGDELKERIDAIDSRAKQVRTLQGLEERLADLWRAKQHLEQLPNVKLDGLEERLDIVRNLLWTAVGDEDLDTAAGELQEAAKDTAKLWHQLPTQRPMPMQIRALSFLEAPELGNLSAIEVLAAAPGAAAAVEAAVAPLPPLPPAPHLSASDAEREVSRARTSQRIVVFLTGLVALASGLAALYVGKAWGTPWDFVSTLIWGMAAQATVGTLIVSIDAMGALRPLRRSA